MMIIVKNTAKQSNNRGIIYGADGGATLAAERPG